MPLNGCDQSCNLTAQFTNKLESQSECLWTLGSLWTNHSRHKYKQLTNIEPFSPLESQNIFLFLFWRCLGFAYYISLVLLSTLTYYTLSFWGGGVIGFKFCGKSKYIYLFLLRMNGENFQTNHVIFLKIFTLMCLCHFCTAIYLPQNISNLT